MIEPYEIIHGDCLDVLRAMPDAGLNACFDVARDYTA